jgi:long-subunit acyl-CoA synthetase (AMP-forming)
MMTHKMVINCAAALNSTLGVDRVTENDICISYLPAAHAYEHLNIC